MQNYQFSFYTSPVASAKHKNNIVDLQAAALSIKDGTYKKIVEAYQNADEALKPSLKKQFPYWTFSGVFQPGTRKESTLEKHSGLIALDIDGKDNTHIKIEIIKINLESDPFILVAFLSPSGTGYKAIIQIDGNKHLESFLALERYFLTKYTIVIDKACKDVCRPCFVSYDPNLYCNENAKPFLVPDVSKQLTIDAPKTKEIHPATEDKKINDIKLLCTEIESKKIDTTRTYETWLKIGFAIAEGLKESGREYFQRISQFHPEYNYYVTDKQFTECMKNRKPGVTFKSLFQVAKEHGITISSKDQNHTANSKAVQPAAETNVYKFWEIKEKHNTDGSKQFLAHIDEVKYLIFLFKQGYRRYDIQNGYSFIKTDKNIIEEVQIQHIQDAFFKYLRSLPEDIESQERKHSLVGKAIKSRETLFGKSLLSILHNDVALTFNIDTKDESFIYYKNGFVKCVPGAYSFHPYTDLKKAIWKERKIDRDFDKSQLKEKGNYEKFISNVAGNDVDRFDSLCTIIGYMLHDFTDGKMKAVVLTDSKISEDNEGRTGKTIFGKALKYIRNLYEIPGKDFNPVSPFKYQGAQISTQIIFLNDVKGNFNLEILYNDITEGITIEKKNQSPIPLRAKYILTSNRTIKTKGASSRDRVTEFEFADYYSDQFSPETEFRQWFFRDWDTLEWNKFDHFMIGCIALYLKHGVIEAHAVNLEKRKLIDQTSKQFYDFVETGLIKTDAEFSLTDMTNEFESRFPEYSFHVNTQKNKKIAAWLKLLPSYQEKFKGYFLENTKRTNEHTYYKFTKFPKS